MRQEAIVHDTIEGRIAFAVDLANTWDVWFDNPEKLREPTALDAFLRDHGLATDGPATEEQLASVRALREEVRSVFQSESAHGAVQRLTGILRGVTVQPEVELSADAAEGIALRYAAVPGASLDDRLRVLAGLGMATALQRWGADRLRSCAADRCEDVFVDTSRNGRRRYCGVRCQNRVNVAAMRQRTSGAGPLRG